MSEWLRVAYNRAVVVASCLLGCTMLVPLMLFVSMFDPATASAMYGIGERTFRGLWRDAALSREEYGNRLQDYLDEMDSW